MKLNGLHWLGITTFILVLVTIFATLNFSFAAVFYLTVIGQVLLVITVFKVLKGNYTTDKTFDDFYEDRPDLGK